MGRSLEHLARLFLSHRPRRPARAALWQVDQFGDVPADEVVLREDFPIDMPLLLPTKLLAI